MTLCTALNFFTTILCRVAGSYLNAAIIELRVFTRALSKNCSQHLVKLVLCPKKSHAHGNVDNDKVDLSVVQKK